MNEGSQRKDTRVLIIVLSVLVSITVLLTIAIILRPILTGRHFSDDNLAKECLKTDDPLAISKCIEEESSKYYEQGDCEKALKVYDDVPEDVFSDKYRLVDLYNEAYSLSSFCDDEALEEYWLGKIDELASQLGGRD